MRSSAGAAGLAALLLAAGAVGCGGTGEAQSPEAPAMKPAAAVAEAAKNTEAITSFRYRMTGKVPGEGRMHGEAAMSVDPPAMSMKMTAEGQADGEMEIRVVDKAMYIGGDTAMAKEMDGKSWIKFDMSALGDDKELGADQFGGGQADQNPAAESAFLTESKNVKKVGTETVDGVRTTHYKGTVTLDALRASLKDKGTDKTARERREKSLKQYEELGVDALTMDMWIGADNRTKQFRMRGPADKGSLDVKITFLDVNKPVTVTAPPAKDTADLAEMMKELDG